MYKLGKLDVYRVHSSSEPASSIVDDLDSQHEEEKQQKVNDFNKVFTLEDDINVSASGAKVPSSLSNPNFNFQLPSKIATMLYPHQREGLNWLWSLHCKGRGGILGGDMGLGKTMHICSFLAGLCHSNLTKRVLVIAPKILLPHWKQELAMVDLVGKTKEYNGTCCAKARHYELQHILQNALSNEHKNDIVTWDYMILDEVYLVLAI
ncbi:SNF2-related, N-terminal domain-containing protein [Tanacetum coccineum]